MCKFAAKLVIYVAPGRRYDVWFPMEEVAIDLMGPFPESDAGNKYIIVLVDSFQDGWKHT